MPNTLRPLVHSENNADHAKLNEHITLTQLKDHLDRLGIDPKAMSNEEIRKALTVPMEGDNIETLYQSIVPDGVPV